MPSFFNHIYMSEILQDEVPLESQKESQKPKFDPKMKLEGITAEQLMALDGEEIHDEEKKLKVEKKDDNSYEITFKYSLPPFLREPSPPSYFGWVTLTVGREKETGNLYFIREDEIARLHNDLFSKYGEKLLPGLKFVADNLIENIGYIAYFKRRDLALQENQRKRNAGMSERGLDPDIHKNEGPEAHEGDESQSSEELFAEINTFDAVVDWFKGRLARVMNETDFGRSRKDVIKVSFNDSDVVKRSLKEVK